MTGNVLVVGSLGSVATLKPIRFFLVSILVGDDASPACGKRRVCMTSTCQNITCVNANGRELDCRLRI